MCLPKILWTALLLIISKRFFFYFIMNMEIKTNSFKFFNLKFNSYGSFFWNMVASSHVKNVGFSLDRWTQTMVMMERRTDKTDLIRSCLFSYHFIYETTWAVLFKFIPTLSLCINSLPRKRHDQCRSFQFDNLYNNPQTLIQLSTVIVCHWFMVIVICWFTSAPTRVSTFTGHCKCKYKNIVLQ